MCSFNSFPRDFWKGLATFTQLVKVRGVILDPFRPLWNVDKTAIFGPKWTIFQPSLVPHSWSVDPKVIKKGSSPGLVFVACLPNPKTPHLEHESGRNLWKMSSICWNSATKWLFWPLSCQERQFMDQTEVSYSYWVLEMIWLKFCENLTLGSVKTMLPISLWQADWK